MMPNPSPSADLAQQPASAADVVRSLLFYVLFYGGSVLIVIALFVVIPFSVAAMRALVHVWGAWHAVCARYVLCIRQVIEGPGGDPTVPDGQVLVAMKHESFYEAIDLPHLFNLPGVFAKAELLRLPLWGNAGKHYGLVGVEREQGAKALRSMVSAARELTGQGRPLVIFPEGTRVPHGQHRALQSGFAGLYKLLGLPVIPAAVDSGPLYQRRWKRKGTITVRFGEAIPPGLPRDEVEARVLAAINALNPLTEAEKPA